MLITTMSLFTRRVILRILLFIFAIIKIHSLLLMNSLKVAVNITGIVLSGFGGLLIALEIIIIIAMCFCCKGTLDSFRKKNKEKEKKIMLVAQTAQAVPIAQPVYPPQQPSYAPQQPSYDPQQPSYAPQQPSYAPQQPSYAPQQPGYIPQQPSYAPQQPNYAPQQTGYIPQYGYPQ